MNTLEVFWGHSPRMRSGGLGDEGSLRNSIGWEFIFFIKTHFMEEHSSPTSIFSVCLYDDVIKWKHFPRHWLLCREFTGDCGEFTSHRWIPFTQWRRALMFSLICAWTNSWINDQDAGNLRRHRAHNDVTVMWCRIVIQWSEQPWDL